MGQTMVEKVISRQVGHPVRAGEKIERLPVTKVFFNDVIGPPAIKTLANLFGETFKKYGKPVKVFDPRRVFLIPDHSVPALSVEVAEGVDAMEAFGREQG